MVCVGSSDLTGMALTLLLFAGGQDRRLDPHLAPHRAFINIEAKSESIERSVRIRPDFFVVNSVTPNVTYHPFFLCQVFSRNRVASS